MDNEISVSSYELDRKRETFARLVASATDIGEAYNIAFNKKLPDTEAFERGDTLCHDEWVAKRIKQFYDDENVWHTIKRKNVAVTLKKIIDCSASDFLEDDGNGGVRIKPVNKWTDGMKVAFKGIKFTRNGTELMTYDKIASANALSGMMGWDKSPEEVKADNDLSGLTSKQLYDTLKDLKELGDDGK